jgi:3-dehydro-L-gulonate 2-dehydrogenase
LAKSFTTIPGISPYLHSEHNNAPNYINTLFSLHPVPYYLILSAYTTSYSRGGFMRISFVEMQDCFRKILIIKGFSPERAELCSRLFAETSLDGVYTHGLNRFPRFLEYIDKGYIDIHALPVLESAMGSLERYDGRLGPGNINAWIMMERACALAKVNGIGCVALKNTNHWMRGGTYGWQAADSNCASICFTNTMPNLPPWGSTEAILGNNPLVMSLPRPEGHIVVDLAMSQFSYGKMERLAMKGKGELLPVEGGYDTEGKLTRDPVEILKTKRPIPTGYWKGSALSTILDLTAALLSGGSTTEVIGKQQSEYGISQIFIAIDCSSSLSDSSRAVIQESINHIHCAQPASPGEKSYYPGERTIITRKDNIEKGIPVDEEIWGILKKF